MKMIIDGKKVDSVSKETFDVIAPATGIVVDNVPKATAEDIEKAVTAAVKDKRIGKNSLLQNVQMSSTSSLIS